MTATLLTHEPPRRQRRFPLAAVLLLAALAVTLAGIFPFRQMIAQNRQVAMTQHRHDTLIEENARLAEQVRLLNTDLEVERIAREQLGLVRPGEVGFRVEPVGPGETAPAEPALVAEERPVWQRIWDFLTGRDLVPDG